MWNLARASRQAAGAVKGEDMTDQSDYFIVDVTLTGALEPSELQAQREFLRRLASEGRLLIAGVVPDVDGRGLAVVVAASLAEARELYAAAPVVAAGKARIEVNRLRITAGLAQSVANRPHD